MKKALSPKSTEKTYGKQPMTKNLHHSVQKETWMKDENLGQQPLSIQSALKMQRIENGSVDCFRAQVLGGGDHYSFGEK